MNRIDPYRAAGFAALLLSAASVSAMIYNMWQLIDWHAVMMLMGAR
jgi:hypothetical protein